MVKPRRKKNESIDTYNERVSKLYYNDGYHIKEIAERLNIDEIEVYNYVCGDKKKITTEAERQMMIYLYNKGYNYTEIARIVGKSRACVTERIKSPAKSKWQNSTDDLTDKQIKMIKDMYNNGASAIDIAKKVGITAGSVKYRLKHMGMKTKYSYVSEKEKKMFINLYKKGLTHGKIAEICGRHRSTVYNHLHKAGYWRSKEK